MMSSVSCSTSKRNLLMIEASKLCCMCLSHERKFVNEADTVQRIAEIFPEILSGFKMNEDKTCWECHYRLKQMLRFYTQVWMARDTLNQIAARGGKTTFMSLSNLGLSYKWDKVDIDPLTLSLDSEKPNGLLNIKKELDNDSMPDDEISVKLEPQEDYIVEEKLSIKVEPCEDEEGSLGEDKDVKPDIELNSKGSRPVINLDEILGSMLVVQTTPVYKPVIEVHVPSIEMPESYLSNQTQAKSSSENVIEKAQITGVEVCDICDLKFKDLESFTPHYQTHFRTAYNHTMADQPDEPPDLRDLPLPSRSNVLTEAQVAASSTSETPFAEPPSIVARKSKAQKQREYRQRIAASRTPAQARAARKSDAERQRICRLRKAGYWASSDYAELVTGLLESTTASSSSSGARSNDVQTGTQRQLTHQQRQTSAAEPAQITVPSGTSCDQIEVQQAHQPIDLTDLPLPSRINVLTEAQDAAASTSATPFAESPTIAAPKSKAQKQREYRQRIAASRPPAPAKPARKSDAERQRICRLRKAGYWALVSGSLDSTTASSSRSGAMSNDVQTATQQQLTHQQRQTSAAEPGQITVQPGISDEIEVQQAHQPTDLTDLPLPSRINVLREAQDASSSTSATPFAEPPTIAAPKSKAQKQREYRQRIAASRPPAQARAARKSDAERQRNCRQRKAAKSALVSGSLESCNRLET